MIEQIKTPEKELNDEEIANLYDAEFKIPVIRMLIGWASSKNEGRNEGYSMIWNKRKK